MRYGMAIDLKRCVGCHTCSVACKSANNLPSNIWWNRVLTMGGDSMDTVAGTYPNNKMQFLPVNCQHCDNPPCVKACPVGATYKRDEDGIVIQDYDKCIGCRMCMVACPYNARSFNWSKPEYYVEHALGDADAPIHQYNVVEKCTFCVNRIARDEKPACMELCIGRARFWGDLDDPGSEVSLAIKGRNYVKLLEEKGTKPSIFYLT
ncbi:4Fe-4S ferredoxin [Desulfitobacterium hafniense]|uniref:4Fe-4S ferredoxin n=1 Tax=Desulfitobacterium hafniense TaxID=49338 RepID=A0A0W1JKT6_DESHA|nr:4Fe-4S dicluster domain-containing protein [Desulfitobacterium hafniense]KTE92423.1 4Fe-4S ferredoxin [Desulfitobacterium hafniense]